MVRYRSNGSSGRRGRGGRSSSHRCWWQAWQEGASKKGDEGPKALLVPSGKGIGELSIRTGGVTQIEQQKAELEAAANDPKAAKGKGKNSSVPIVAEGQTPPPPVPPENDPIPCELQRKLKLTVRRVNSTAVFESEEEADIKKDPLESGTLSSTTTSYSEPIPFWLRNLSQEQLASGLDRYPCDSYVYNEGNLVTSPPIISPTTTNDSEEASKAVVAGEPSEILDLEAGAEAAASDVEGSSVTCHLIPQAGGSVSFTTLTSTIPGASEALNFTIDFKINATDLEARYAASKSSEGGKGGETLGNNEAAESNTSASTSEAIDENQVGAPEVEAEMDHVNSSETPLVNVTDTAGAPKPYEEFTLLTLSELYEGEVVTNGKSLALVVLIPEDNFKTTNSSGQDESTIASMGQKESNDKGTGEIQLLEKKKNKWCDVLVELRHCSNDSDESKNLGDGGRSIGQWTIADSLDADAWHSLALCLDNASDESVDAVRVALDGDFLERSSAHALAEAEVDDGVALAWLPEGTLQRETREMKEQEEAAAQDAAAFPASNQDEGNHEEADAVDQAKGDILVTTTPAPASLPRLRVRGGGAGFSGAIKLLALVSPRTAPHHSILDCTRVYADWAAREQRGLSLSELTGTVGPY